MGQFKFSNQKTIVKVIINKVIKEDIDNTIKFNLGKSTLYIGEYSNIKKVLIGLSQNDYYIDFNSHNSILPLKNYLNIECRVEPGSIIRSDVKLKKNCVILMGAIVNTGSIIGSNTMIDMNAVIGAGAIVGDYCHIGAGAVIAGMLEPKSNVPVNIGNNTLIGANSVILEEVKIGNNVIVGAGSVVTKDIPDNVICYGNPCKVVKVNEKESFINKELR